MAIKQIKIGSGNAIDIWYPVSLAATSETVDDVSGVKYVQYVTQSLTDAQKIQARSNIGAEISQTVTSVTSGTLSSASANNIYVFNVSDGTAITISGFAAATSGISVYTFIFKNIASLSLPSSVKWFNGSAPTIKNNVVYELSVFGMPFSSGTVYTAVLAEFA